MKNGFILMPPQEETVYLSMDIDNCVVYTFEDSFKSRYHALKSVFIYLFHPKRRKFYKPLKNTQIVFGTKTKLDDIRFDEVEEGTYYEKLAALYPIRSPYEPFD